MPDTRLQACATTWHNMRRSAQRAILVMLSSSMVLTLSACHTQRPDANSVTMLIESSPANLDPRIGTDAQSEHIDELIFDALVHRDEHFNLRSWLAQSWETPNPLTYIFHLRPGVRFHNGQPLTSRDVKWTLDSILHNQIITTKSGSFNTVDRVEATDPLTVVVHMKKPDAAFLWNVSDGSIGIIPDGSGRDFWQNPIGTGPFRFVRQQADQEVVLDRNPDSWQPLPSIAHIRFAVVPDAITRALELEKGSGDVCINALTADMVRALQAQPQLAIETGPGTILNYISFNVSEPLLRDVRVRQAIAFAINRPLIIHSLWRDRARAADSLLPTDHWAWTSDTTHYPYDPDRANQLLDAAGFRRNANGIRLHLSMKTSTDETSRLFALILQQQLRQVGIALEVRSFEFATFYADISKGAFQMYTLRWIGGNENPDIFRYAYSTASFPPRGANRGHYSNPKLDKLIDEAATSNDEGLRRENYVEVQKIVAAELPSINLWYLDTVLVHNRRLGNIHLSSSGNYDFLREATLRSAL